MTAGLPRFLAVDWNGTVVPWFGEAAYPDALAVLAELRAQGVRLAIVSHATPREITDDVARVGLEADEVYGVGAKAPALIRLAELWGDGGHDWRFAPGCARCQHRWAALYSGQFWPPNRVLSRICPPRGLAGVASSSAHPRQYGILTATFRAIQCRAGFPGTSTWNLLCLSAFSVS